MMSDFDLAEYNKQKANDPRTNEELISTALSHPSDDDLYWDAVLVLGWWRDAEEVLNCAKTLCQSSQSVERRLGADLLGQLGCPEQIAGKECLATLLGMLNIEQDVAVLHSILKALGHLKQPAVIAPACRYRKHPCPDVRYGVVLALIGLENQQAVESLIELSHDDDARVRDWATFGLGSMLDWDTPVLREALFERLSDTDYDTRHEAIVGLAKRKDFRVAPVISKELASNCVERLVIEAILAIPSPEFYSQLIALKEWWDVDHELLDEVIKACLPSTSEEATGTP
jgi:HEAT repeat protein